MSWKSIKGTAQGAKDQTEPEITGMQEVEDGFSKLLDTDDMTAALDASRKKEKRAHRNIGSTDYYFTVYFNSADQMIEFCQTFGLNPNSIHMDGREVAKQFRRALSTPDEPKPKHRATSREYMELAQGKRS